MFVRAKLSDGEGTALIVDTPDIEKYGVHRMVILELVTDEHLVSERRLKIEFPIDMFQMAAALVQARLRGAP